MLIHFCILGLRVRRSLVNNFLSWTKLVWLLLLCGGSYFASGICQIWSVKYFILFNCGLIFAVCHIIHDLVGITKMSVLSYKVFKTIQIQIHLNPQEPENSYINSIQCCQDIICLKTQNRKNLKIEFCHFKSWTEIRTSKKFCKFSIILFLSRNKSSNEI